jgi:hypothetical protein
MFGMYFQDHNKFFYFVLMLRIFVKEAIKGVYCCKNEFCIFLL